MLSNSANLFLDSSELEGYIGTVERKTEPKLSYDFGQSVYMGAEPKKQLSFYRQDLRLKFPLPS
jgi:hypothetical protein